VTKTAPEPEPPYTSFLAESAPEYLVEIGTLSVELVQMEIALAHLLGAITRLPPNVAEAIYFSPQATGPRIAILKNCAAECFKAYPNYLTDTRKLLEDATKIAVRRNDIIHQAWGLTEDGKVAASPLPISEERMRHVPLSQISETVRRLRFLMGRLRDLIDAIAADQTYSPWPQKLLAQAPTAMGNDRPEGVHQAQQVPPRPSRA
jgi:hypothetical protein